MRNSQTWVETKVVRKGSSFVPSSDCNVVGIGSRVALSCQIACYEQALVENARGRLIDLGCGHVPYYSIYNRLVTETICVDWNNTSHKNELLDASMNLNQPLSIDSDSFDTVLLLDVLEHIARPVELLAEVSRILRAGGKVIVGVPFFYWLHEQPYDFYRFTEFALVEMCKSSGLDVISLAPYGGVPEILVDVSGKCLAAANQNLGRAYVSTCALALALRPVRSLSRRTSKLFPYGYILVARKGTTAGIVPSGGGSPDENRVI